ncbi:hypothetical protein AMJ80_06545 [bacterium SM23_31]|nr:MAG: hypothetical protein AMJ80_06545 [bacterium SM23_31]
MENISTDKRKEPIFPIGVAAKMVGVSPSTLRMYETEGLLIPYKTTTKMRLFTEEDLDWIRYIRSLIKKDKLSVEGIRRILSLIPCWKIRNCTPEARKSCAANSANLSPCWTVKNAPEQCGETECRLCSVYRYARQAFDTKKMLADYTNY